MPEKLFEAKGIQRSPPVCGGQVVSACRGRRGRHPVPEKTAEEILNWIGSGRPLTHYCRRRGTPCVRTVYNWARKDSNFARRLSRARDLGETAIREEIRALASSPEAAAACKTRAQLRAFKRTFLWPRIQLLKRWRRRVVRKGPSK
jgi:hypothetical protein